MLREGEISFKEIKDDEVVSLQIMKMAAFQPPLEGFRGVETTLVSARPFCVMMRATVLSTEGCENLDMARWEMVLGR